ncbi:uncharacterized protein [Primulina eburnea]|uniref:uncharacterized protein n=1 Tax=Primulina eburnea TaxID=1245227 RepID=UPI003C6C3089
MTMVDAVLKVAKRVLWRKSRHMKFLQSTTTFMTSIKPKQQADKSATAAAAEHEGMDPTKYHENRLRYLAAQKEAGNIVYPHEYELTLTIPEFIKRYESLNNGDYLKDAEERIAGRLMISSSKLFLHGLHGCGAKVQVMADARKFDLNEEEFSKYHSSVMHGDIVVLIGFPGKSMRGELSIFPKTFIVLSHCLHNMPQPKIGSVSDIDKVIDPWVPGRVRNLETYTLKDEETRYRWRFLDLILNMEVRDIFWTRRNLISYIRRFLDNRGFLAVETPIMNMIAGGATTRPFVTHHNDLNMELYLRISPGLFLKQLVVGGLDRVYEIGKQFINEGIDLTHNPEFTTCTFYMAYEDYYDLMKLTEEMLSGMVKELTGGYIIKYHANGLENDPIEIDFTPPFRRIDVIDELEKLANLCIPEDLSGEEANKYLLDTCSKFDIKCSPPLSTARLLDKLVGHFLKETCMSPTFITNHPEIMSPLAKRHRSKPGRTERFELFINKFEVSNAYTVLNNPVVQRQRFAEQHKNRQSGNDEAMTLDETFLLALEYGLPPTGGCELNVDRLAMLLTDSQNIKEVLLYPTMKPLDDPSDKKSRPKMTMVDAILKEPMRLLWRKYLDSRENRVVTSTKPKQQVEKSGTAEHESMDPTQYYENRLRSLAAQKEDGNDQYAYKPTLTIHEYIERYKSLNSGDHLKDVEERIAGRLMNKRSSSSKLFFYDLHGGGAKVQVMADARESDLNEEEFCKFHSSIKRGDNVGIIGFPGKSKRGELSIFPKTFIVLSQCLHMMQRPKIASGSNNSKVADSWVPGHVRNLEAYTLKDQETRYRWRFLDLLLNTEVPKLFWARRNVISYIRSFLDTRGFLEVETALMNNVVGGAAARPFVTHLNVFDKKVYMRVAPELNLKQLVVGGFGCVYEIGKQFRNEGIDLTHNPEFTTCELYMAYADYYDLMKLTEEMLSGMVKELTGGYIIKYHANGLDNDPVEIDFTPPFRIIDIIDELEKLADLSIPKDLSSEEANMYLSDVCSKFDIKCPPPQTTARLLDKLVGHFLEETCRNPTFIINHPEIMSPLAKWHRSKPGLTERFELFINKFEVCNSYTELNDPVVQRQRFANQLKDRQSGDDEAMVSDESFLRALEYGLPPTAGWGLGVDRLTMLLTDSQNIKEVILFPAMKPQDDRSDKERATQVQDEPSLRV